MKIDGIYRLGIDIGGTFTDFVLLNEETGENRIGKNLTTPEDPSEGVITGLKSLIEEENIDPHQISTIVHGTTLVTNALIERKGSKTGLITTEGFRDALEIANQYRFDPYDVYLEKPEPLVPRHLRFTVDERVLADGTVSKPLDQEELEERVRKFQEMGVEAIAICFMNSYKNGVHEKEALKIINEIAPGMYVSISSEVIPEIREYERTSTTVCNVFVKATVEKYLQKVIQRLKELGFEGNFFMMLSNGGICTVETACEFTIRILESGPAAGALAASMYGEKSAFPNVLSFDMGGTTAKSCIIENNTPLKVNEFEVARVYRFKKGSGLPIKASVIEMIEIGAGGGSIAYIDKFGLLKVGPQSAGSNPGPVSYGLGGTEPTVTDADLVLGYLDPDFFLGGKMKLDKDAAYKAIKEKIADPLGLDPIEAAWGIHKVVNENMSNAARIHAIEYGKDLAQFPLFAFGGAGPVHAYNVARNLGVDAVALPLGAGTTSALGLLCAPLAFDYVRSYFGRLDVLDWNEVNRFFAEMTEEGRKLLTAAGLRDEDIIVRRSCDMRYVGQGHEANVILPEGELKEGRIDEIEAFFQKTYEELFHQKGPDMPLEVLTWRVSVSGPRPQIPLESFKQDNFEKALKGEREVYFDGQGGFIKTPVYDRYLLGVGFQTQGPAVFEEHESTVVVGVEAKDIKIDEQNNLIVRWR